MSIKVNFSVKVGSENGDSTRINHHERFGSLGYSPHFRVICHEGASTTPEDDRLRSPAQGKAEEPPARSRQRRGPPAKGAEAGKVS
jgi:hypothetical protein